MTSEPTDIAPTASSPTSAVEVKRTWKTWQAATASGVALVLGIAIGGAGSPDPEVRTASAAASSGKPTATTAPRVSDDDDSTPTTEKATTTTQKPTTTTTAKPAEVGTRSNPLPVGQAAALSGPSGDEWLIKVVGFNPNGTDAVRAENMFNDPPAPGRQFAMVRLEATYVGNEEPQSIMSSLSFKTLDAANVSYDSDDDCGVVPDELDTWGDVYKGGVVTGWTCWSVTSEHIDSLLLVVEPSWAFDSDPYFMAVK